MAAKPKAVDWISVEADYRAGVKTLRAIGKDHGVSNVAVLKRAKRDGWTRDLAAAIKAKAEDKVSRSVVSAEVSKQRQASAERVVEANAEIQAQAILGQRKTVGRLNGLAEKLTERLESDGELKLTEKVATFQKLTDTRKTIIGLERLVLGIDKNSVDNDLASFLKGLDAPRAAA